MALKRKGLLKVLFLGLVLGLFSIIIPAYSAFGEEPVFGPQTYYRSPGAPTTEVDTLTVENPSATYCFTITNGEGEEHRISSGTI